MQESDEIMFGLCLQQKKEYCPVYFEGINQIEFRKKMVSRVTSPESDIETTKNDFDET